MGRARAISEERAIQPAIPLEYRHILDTLADPVLAADIENRIVYANHAVEPLLGWEPNELIGQPIITIIPAEYREQHLEGFSRFMKTGRSRIVGHPVRVSALARNGGRIDIELSLSAFRLPSGGQLVVASLRDLRERVALEREVEVASLLRSTTRTAAQLTTLLDRQKVMESVTNALVSDFGAALARIWLYEPEENVLILRSSAGVTSRTRESSWARLDVATNPYKISVVARQRVPFIRNGVLGDPEFNQEWIQRDGIEAAAIFPLVYGGELLGVLGYFSRQSISDQFGEVLATFAAIVTTSLEDVRRFELEHESRAQAEAAEARSSFLAEAGDVLASSLDYNTTLSNVAQLAVSHLADWCLVDILQEDGSAKRITVAHADPAMRSVVEQVEREYPSDPTVSDAERRVMDSCKPILIPEISEEQVERGARDEKHLRLIQQLQPLSYMCVPLVLHDRSVGAISFLTSRTSGRVYGDADLQLAQELARRAAIAVDNARLYRQLQETVQSRDEFLSSVSHDLKNPIAAIKARAQILRRRAERMGDDGARLVDGLDSIDSAATKMTRLINDLVDVVHLRAGRPLTLLREDVDLVALVRQVAQEQQTGLSRTIDVQTDLEKLPARVDAVRIERVLTNLVSNAVKYSPDGGAVTIRIETETQDGDQTALITVSDRGIGIPEADLPHIFERFYRAGNTEGIAGSGIGLAGALQIVQHHGGTIEAQSDEGAGSSFTVRLPL